MRGKLGHSKWAITDDDSGSFFTAQRIVGGKLETRYKSAHCLACAKSDILAEYGGEVDLRGHHTSLCGVMLLAMQSTVNAEPDKQHIVTKLPKFSNAWGRQWEAILVILPDGQETIGMLDVSRGTWVYFPHPDGEVHRVRSNFVDADRFVLDLLPKEDLHGR